MKTIDLRSDTVTLPTPAMQGAIFDAELGDDVFGEDPTTNRLEEMAAERIGKEAAMGGIPGKSHLPLCCYTTLRFFSGFGLRCTSLSPCFFCAE